MEELDLENVDMMSEATTNVTQFTRYTASAVVSNVTGVSR